MPSRVEIIQKRELFHKLIFRIEEVTLRHEKYDGTMSQPLTRLNLDRGDSVAALLYNPGTDELIFTEQFRYPTHTKGDSWLLEIVAGMVDGDEDPADAMRREITEEIGYEVQTLHKINTFYTSPGGTSERVHLFYAAVSYDDKIAEGGGVPYEGEDIRTYKITTQEALQRLERQQIQDAKTLIALQWFKLHRDELPTGTS